MKKIILIMMLLPTLNFAATRNVVPNAPNEGSIGTATNQFGYGYFSNLNVNGTAITGNGYGWTNTVDSTTYTNKGLNLQNGTNTRWVASNGTNYLQLLTNSMGVAYAANAAYAGNGPFIFNNGGDYNINGIHLIHASSGFQILDPDTIRMYYYSLQFALTNSMFLFENGDIHLVNGSYYGMLVGTSSVATAISSTTSNALMATAGGLKFNSTTNADEATHAISADSATSASSATTATQATGLSSTLTNYFRDMSHFTNWLNAVVDGNLNMNSKTFSNGTFWGTFTGAVYATDSYLNGTNMRPWQITNSVIPYSVLGVADNTNGPVWLRDLNLVSLTVSNLSGITSVSGDFSGATNIQHAAMPYFSVYMAETQAVIGTVWLSATNVLYDTHGGFSQTTTNYTFPSGHTGIYELSAQCRMISACNTLTQLYFEEYKPATGCVAIGSVQTTLGNLNASIPATTIIYTGGVHSIRAVISVSGGNSVQPLKLNTWWTVKKVRDL